MNSMIKLKEQFVKLCMNNKENYKVYQQHRNRNNIKLLNRHGMLKDHHLKELHLILQNLILVDFNLK